MSWVSGVVVPGGLAVLVVVGWSAPPFPPQAPISIVRITTRAAYRGVQQGRGWVMLGKLVLVSQPSTPTADLGRLFVFERPVGLVDSLHRSCTRLASSGRVSLNVIGRARRSPLEKRHFSDRPALFVLVGALLHPRQTAGNCAHSRHTDRPTRPEGLAHRSQVVLALRRQHSGEPLHPDRTTDASRVDVAMQTYLVKSVATQSLSERASLRRRVPGVSLRQRFPNEATRVGSGKVS